eukprot:scaffold22_cov107-Isochrysis_galbana.AAC.4
MKRSLEPPEGRCPSKRVSPDPPGPHAPEPPGALAPEPPTLAAASQRETNMRLKVSILAHQHGQWDIEEWVNMSHTEKEYPAQSLAGMGNLLVLKWARGPTRHPVCHRGGLVVFLRFLSAHAHSIATRAAA